MKSACANVALLSQRYKKILPPLNGVMLAANEVSDSGLAGYKSSGDAVTPYCE